MFYCTFVWKHNIMKNIREFKGVLLVMEKEKRRQARKQKIQSQKAKRQQGKNQKDVPQPEKKPKDVEQQRAARKKAAIIVGSVFAFLLVLYLGIAWFFRTHFYLGTMINENDFGLKSVAQVEEFMKEHVANYELTLKGAQGHAEVIRGADIALSYVESDELAKLLDTQNPFLWPKALWERDKVEAQVGVQYDLAQLEAVIASLSYMDPEGKIESVSAYPRFEESQYMVEPEVIGTQIDEVVLREKIELYINGFIDVLDMMEEECYKRPTYISTSPEIIQLTADLNQALTAQVTYEVAPQTEVVDAALISQWLIVDEEMQVGLDTDLVREYVEGLATKYNTVGTTRNFTTAYGQNIEVQGGDYGWMLDKDAETDLLIENIKSKEPVTREPVFYSRGADHGTDNDFGSTRVEVDLTNQRMCFIQDGQIVLETDIVTGLPSRSPTPQGTYTLTYKTRNAVLRAPLRADGTREYETPVSFWMPFNGGIGFHDATWQSSFGGSRYQTNGSHGCINMPRSKAEELYHLIGDDMAIICHY